MLVLTIKREQLRADVAQLGDRGRAAVQVGASAPVGADTAAENDLLDFGRQSFAKQPADGVREVECALDIGLVRPRANDSGPRPTTEEKIERVCQHGLA